MLMRAAVLTEFRSPMEVREVEIADPGPGEVRVEIAASGVCGSDIKAIDGKSPVVREPPSVLGHESAGVVESVGAGVTTVGPGDQVIIAMNGPCGRCRNCAAGWAHLCSGPARLKAIMGLMGDGTTRLSADGSAVRPFIGIGSFAEYAVVGEAMCVKVPSTAPLDLLCLLACGVSTGVGAVLNVARVRPGSSVLVAGCGGVGLNVVQGAVLAGATTIIAADLVESKLEAARKAGATHTLGPGEPLKRAGEIERGGVDYAFDATGVPAVIAEAFAATRPGGTTVMVGSPPSGETLPIDGQSLFASRRLIGTQGGDVSPARDLPMLARLAEQGRLDLESLVSERLPLARINNAVEHVRQGTVARSVITP